MAVAKYKWLGGVAVALFLGPVFVGLWAELRKPNGFGLGDLHSATCAGDALLHGASPYLPGDCPFTPSAEYVYPPFLAMLMAALQRALGPRLEMALLVALLVAAFAVVLHAMLFCPREDLIYRAPFFCGVTVKAVASGNVSIIFHAMIFAALIYVSIDWVLLLIVIFCIASKPTFISYVPIFLFLDRPLLQRLSYVVIALVATFAYFALFHIHMPVEFGQWLFAVKTMGLSQTGQSLLGLPGMAKKADPHAMIVLYGVFASLLVGAGLWLREWLPENQRDRLYLGIAICVLINPRMMAYDAYILPFGMAVVAQLAARSFTQYSSHFYAGLAILWFVVASSGWIRGGETLFVACCAMILALAAALWARDQRALKGA